LNSQKFKKISKLEDRNYNLEPIMQNKISINLISFENFNEDRVKEMINVSQTPTL
jgi:hypothetical protein